MSMALWSGFMHRTVRLPDGRHGRVVAEWHTAAGWHLRVELALPTCATCPCQHAGHLAYEHVPLGTVELVS